MAKKDPYAPIWPDQKKKVKIGSKFIPSKGAPPKVVAPKEKLLDPASVPKFTRGCGFTLDTLVQAAAQHEGIYWYTILDYYSNIRFQRKADRDRWVNENARYDLNFTEKRLLAICAKLDTAVAATKEELVRKQAEKEKAAAIALRITLAKTG